MSAADRELLDLAAIAAGIKTPGKPPNWMHPGVEIPTDFGHRWWNPLRDDGDALRLAVAIQPLSGCAVLCLSIGKERTGCEFRFVDGPDAAANTRRAIVVAAAEIGRGLSDKPASTGKGREDERG
ncbi:hypothetical protein [Herbaspirillum sp. NPDC101396]|uniref:hypothetical protein n=1 Tax=Herbaspirillum sp. NPDC101396 TaxID=3364005 RepID=UPI00383AEBC2